MPVMDRFPGRARRGIAALAAGASLVGVLAAPASGSAIPVTAAAPTRPTPGSGSAGDPYFPRQGNGGYDVTHYRLRVAYQPASRSLVGRAGITATATKALSSFHLDLRDRLRVSSVTVDGRPAAFTQPRRLVQELVITPARALAAGRPFTVVVRYAGPGRQVTDPDGSPDGWIPTDDGAFVASEPQGSPSWFPVNDTPRDKATYAVTVVVPRGLVGVSNGQLVRVRRRAHTTVWSWALHRRVSSYLVTASVGHFRITSGRTPDGVPWLDAVDPREATRAAPALAKLPAIVDFYSSVYGRYPFGVTGAIVDRAYQVGYALETATRPVFDRAPDQLTLAHELAHQWFGDTVTLARWRDIWLNEGFAEFSSWLWDEHRGGTTAAQHLTKLLAQPASAPVWNPPPGNPGSAKAIFSNSVYERGAGALEALRQRLGDATFFRILRGWVALHRYGNARVPQFTAYAARVAHQDLSGFFTRWLYRPGKP